MLYCALGKLYRTKETLCNRTDRKDIDITKLVTYASGKRIMSHRLDHSFQCNILISILELPSTYILYSHIGIHTNLIES